MGNRFIIHKREVWKAVAPKEVKPLEEPVDTVVLHHTMTETCYDKKGCKALIKKLQEKHMNEENLADIKFNFLIGGDGEVYEGRGWKVQGEHVQDHDDYTIGIALIGNYHTDVPSIEMQEICRGLLFHGVRWGYLKQGVELYPHTHFDMDTYCPGLNTLDEYMKEVILDTNEFWRKRNFLEMLWDKIRGIED